MAADVVLTDDAKQELKELKNVVIVTRIRKLVDRLKNWPHVSGVKALRGELAGKFRVRTGDYRVQFRVERIETEEKSKPVTRQRVVIEKVGHRDGFYGG